ncbi:hypothetical protein ACFUJR_39015, partial [Streptomyces sp. NPDC057271]
SLEESRRLERRRELRDLGFTWEEINGHELGVKAAVERGDMQSAAQLEMAFDARVEQRATGETASPTATGARPQTPADGPANGPARGQDATSDLPGGEGRTADPVGDRTGDRKESTDPLQPGGETLMRQPRTLDDTGTGASDQAPPTPEQILARNTGPRSSDPLDAVLVRAADEQGMLPSQLRRSLDEALTQARELHTRALADGHDPQRTGDLLEVATRARDLGRLHDIHSAIDELQHLTPPTEQPLGPTAQPPSPTQTPEATGQEQQTPPQTPEQQQDAPAPEQSQGTVAPLVPPVMPLTPGVVPGTVPSPAPHNVPSPPPTTTTGPTTLPTLGTQDALPRETAAPPLSIASILEGTQHEPAASDAPEVIADGIENQADPDREQTDTKEVFGASGTPVPDPAPPQPAETAQDTTRTAVTVTPPAPVTAGVEDFARRLDKAPAPVAEALWNEAVARLVADRPETTTVLAQSPAQLRTHNPALYTDVLNTARDLNPLQTPADRTRVLTDLPPAPENHTDLRTEPEPESFAIDKTPESLRSLQELSRVVDTEALLAFEAGPYHDLTPGQVLRARQIVAETIHFPTLLDTTGDAGRHGHLKDWATVAVAQALTSTGQQTATALRQATDMAERIRRDRGLERPKGLLGGTRPQDTEQTQETGQNSTQAQATSQTQEGETVPLSPLARQVDEMAFVDLFLALGELPSDLRQGLEGRARQLMREHFPPGARLDFDDQMPRLEFAHHRAAIAYALHLGADEPTPEAAATELVQLYASEHPYGYRAGLQPLEPIPPRIPFADLPELARAADTATSVQVGEILGRAPSLWEGWRLRAEAKGLILQHFPEWVPVTLRLRPRDPMESLLAGCWNRIQIALFLQRTAPTPGVAADALARYYAREFHHTYGADQVWSTRPASAEQQSEQHAEGLSGASETLVPDPAEPQPAETAQDTTRTAVTVTPPAPVTGGVEDFARRLDKAPAPVAEALWNEAVARLVADRPETTTVL